MSHKQWLELRESPYEARVRHLWRVCFTFSIAMYVLAYMAVG